ncbi:MAG: DUF4270 domain-containing protein [Lentimicrobiaceae bacterium]|nr:DUF4270 domain-containing protein [Lentimicrobiaceae bacterium]
MHRNKSLFAFFIASLLLLVFSCNKEPDFVGLDLLPGGDRLDMGFTDTLTVQAYTISEKPLRTDVLAVNLLGYMNDTTFGKVSASLYTQYRLSSSNFKFGEGAVGDSMFLTLVYAGRYGDTLSPHRIRVYELDEKPDPEKKYYSNDTCRIKSNPIGDITFVPNFKPDTTKKLPAMLRIPLSYEFMQKFITADETTLSANNFFMEVFKGLYLEADPDATTGMGSMLYFNLLHAESKLQLYYHNNSDTAAKVSFLITENVIKFNHYNHDYSSATPLLKQQLQGDTLAGEQKLFLQAMAGTRVNLRIPYINNIPEKEKMAINEAMLVFTNADPLSMFLPPPQLSLRMYSDTGEHVIPEERYNTLYFGGQYQKRGEYFFRITKYVQERMMHPEKPDYGLTLIVSGAALNSNRVVLYGPGSETSALKLKIYYSMTGL